MPLETRDEWYCWEIMNGGEGERAHRRKVLAVRHCSVSDAATYYSEMLDEEERRRDRLDISYFDGDIRVVEVEICDGGFARFRVACRVERSYAAISVPV